MTRAELGELFDRQVSMARAKMFAKQAEYAEDGDALCNFKGAARLQACSVPQAIAGTMAKPTVSIYDMIYNGRPYPIETWDEKINDHINYLILLRAAISENTEPPNA